MKRCLKHKTAGLLLCICALLLTALSPAAYAAEQDQGQTVRVGYMLMKNFEEEENVLQSGQDTTVRSGYAYEYLQVLRYYTGWQYEYVNGTWDNLLTLLEKGEIDLLSHVAKTPEREETMLFSTEPQGRETHYLYVDGPSDAIDPADYSTLNGKNVGVIRGDFRTKNFLAWCEDKGVTCNILEYTDIDEIHRALHSGYIHAASASSTVIASCPDGKWNPVIRFDDTMVYFAVKKGPEGEKMLKKINDAQRQILAINENFGLELQQKYTSQQTIPATLTEAEKLWLQNRGELVVGYVEKRRPLAYTDSDGNLAGLLADYLEVMEKNYSMRFRTVAYPDGTSVLTALQNGEVDIIAPVGYNHGMAELYGMAVTSPLTVETMVAVYKGYKGTEPKDIFEQLAILDSSITEKDYAQRFYPDSQWVRADSVTAAIDLVANDKAGCYIMRSSTWSWYKNEYRQLNDLQVLTLPHTNDVNMTIRNADIQLLPILNKGISLLSAVDVNQSLIANSNVPKEVTWLTVMRENPVATTLGILATVLLIGLVFVVYRLQTEKRYLKKLEEANHRAQLARQEAERANLAKSTFLTSMSHDIRTPMNAIIGMTTLASKHLNNPEYVRGCLSKVTLASDHLLTLINDVLDINKIEAGNLSLTPNVFSLADSIMNLANIGRHQLREKEHHFEIRVHNIRQEYLFADELRINQVFINLLSNAVKYTPTGGRIVIDVKQEPIAGERSKIRLIYEIQDTGIGMSAEFQEHMYELFAMANRNSRTVTGSGVGLAICKQLVDLMEGRILCESEAGKGTKFTVILDLPIADRVADQLILPPMKILLVDDDEVFLATASETLQELGLSPDCISSGEAAVETVRQRHQAGKDYPLIIIDWQMPDMDGIETTRRIRSLVGPEVSIIVISAYAPEDIQEAAFAAGANGFINKPFFRSNAYQSISEVLGLTAEVETAQPDAHRKVKGMHLLIAEDNDLNWEIARELLAMYGVEAHRAEHGGLCVDMLKNAAPGTYDAVLMDIQMPVMNGYDAAIAIRRSDRPDLQSLPIVAMTADAYTEDVLRCAQSGMNGHIPKPIDMEKLLEVLSSFTR